MCATLTSSPQSKECQKAHWRAGHKDACDFHHLVRERATALTGNPKAWSDLATFIEFHHTTLVNCTLANFLYMKPLHPRAAAEHIVHFSLRYRNDPALPAHKKFEPRGVYIAHRDEAMLPGNDGGYAAVWRERDFAIKMGKRELGSAYAATGAYYLMVKFGDDAEAGNIPFWKHFGIDDWRWNALPSVRKPWDIFKETIEEGKKMKFCCGQLVGLGTCCCGGWTHTP
ncbi:hypothetical protein TRAPUB_3869, partial [Trametes pubescens]